MATYGVPGAGHNVTAARAAYEVTAVSRRAPRSSAPAAPAPSLAGSVRISDGAELLGKLRQLHDAHPKGFKHLMRELADDLQREAEQAAGRPNPQLSQLAERFDQAAREGNITPLVPAIEAARTRAPYARGEDALLAPSEAVRALFRGFVDKIGALMPLGNTPHSTARSG